MTASVLKPFNSTARRFAVGDPVNAGDDLAPHAYQDLVERNFIGAAVPDAKEPRIPLKAAKSETVSPE